MALIRCQECGKEISDKAKACPNCGCPLIIYPTKIKKNKYIGMRRGFGITNLVWGLLLFTLVLSSESGISGNSLQMAASWFLILNGLISIIGTTKKPAVIVSIVLYALSIMYFIGIMREISGFAILAIMDIVFITLTSISLSCKESFN